MPETVTATAKKETRSRVHSMKKTYFGMWMPTDVKMRLRRVAKNMGMSMSDYVLDRITSLDGVRVTDTDAAWKFVADEKNRKRRY